MSTMEPLPAKLGVNVECSLEEFLRTRELEDRRLYLNGEIESLDFESKCIYVSVSMTGKLVEQIFDFNRADKGLPINEREPIRLYINSPGGEITEGFSLLSAIETSKTPIYTINVGEWCSMAFLIGIAGHKRFAMPYTTFLMHEGSSFAGGSAGKMQDRAKFNERFKHEVIKAHVLKHSDMNGVDYDALERVELYMLPEDALARGFIDEIVTDIDDIL
ncbi:ATP-dependent Clp protease proteolytic subunit [Candidatus Saccharibacteria bacterium]|nr:ATP-dependent Clp protease proteolytic subunit [Candidatus Saccharibacteria bacterium]